MEDAVEKLIRKILDLGKGMEEFSKKKSISLYEVKLDNLKGYSSIKKANAIKTLTEPFVSMFNRHKEKIINADFSFLKTNKPTDKIKIGDGDAYIPLSDIYYTLVVDYDDDDGSVNYLEFALIELLSTIIKDEDLKKTLDKYDIEKIKKEENKKKESTSETVLNTFSMLKDLYGKDDRKNRSAMEIMGNMKENTALMDQVEKFSQATAKDPKAIMGLLGNLTKN